MAKAILLVRVSTQIQDYEAQKNDLIRYANSLGYSNEDQIIIANKESAIKLSDEEREGLTEMYRILDEDENNGKQINAIFVWEISRIGRQEQTILNIKNKLIERKTQLYIYNPSFQLLNVDGTPNPTSEIIFAILSIMAKQEMLLKKERLLRTRKANSEKGKLGSGKPLFGYTVDSEKNIIEDEDAADTVREIYDMYAKGESTLRIYKILFQRGKIEKIDKKKNQQDFIKRILSNPSYCGMLKEGKAISDGKNKGKVIGSCSIKYPAIISVDTFEKVAKIRHDRFQGEKKDTENVYYGKGIIKYTDGTIIEAMCARRSSIDYYSTTKHATINMNIMDSILWYEAKKQYHLFLNAESEESKKDLERNIKDLQMKVAAAQNIIVKNTKTIDRTNKRIVEGKMSEESGDAIITECKSSITDATNVLTHCKEQLAILEAKKNNMGNGNENTTVEDIERLLSTDVEKQGIIKDMISKVIVKDSGKGTNKTITLFNRHKNEIQNHYLYEHSGRRHNLYVMNDEGMMQIDMNTFVTVRFERMKKGVAK